MTLKFLRTIFFSRNGKSNFSDVVNYIANNVHKDLREEEAAALCHYSPTYFSKVFHRKVGMCFRDYVTAKRISLAKKNADRERIHENRVYRLPMWLSRCLVLFSYL